MIVICPLAGTCVYRNESGGNHCYRHEFRSTCRGSCKYMEGSPPCIDYFIYLMKKNVRVGQSEESTDLKFVK